MDYVQQKFKKVVQKPGAFFQKLKMAVFTGKNRPQMKINLVNGVHRINIKLFLEVSENDSTGQNS